MNSVKREVRIKTYDTAYNRLRELLSLEEMESLQNQSLFPTLRFQMITWTWGVILSALWERPISYSM